MKLKSVKIENYKSFGEENNTLMLEDINTIIGKNESGKSNLIDCLSYIDLTGINDDDFFKKFNKNTNGTPVISVQLIPDKEEIEKYKIKGETNIILTDKYDISIMGSFSEMIHNNKNFQKNREKLNNLNIDVVNILNEQNQRNNYNNIIKMINDAENKMFINHTYIDYILNKISNNSDYEEFSTILNECVSYLKEIQSLLPKFIKITDESLKSKYTLKYLDDDTTSKVMLNHLLNCINMNFNELRGYWNITNEADKENFSESFNEKLDKIINNFNNFYTQEKVIMKAKFENDSLNFIIKTTKKYLNFEERSNGLKWYLNMYIQILSKTNNSIINNYIILIDEPGVYLHVNAQKEILKLFEDFSSKNNQVIYTTHSPFMIYEKKLHRTRLIIKDENGNSNIGNKYYSLPHKMGSKSETLTPLLTAIGMSMNYNILSINNEKENIITEGISDYNYLKGYYYLKKIKNMPNIIPSAGVNNIINIISILIGWGCSFKIILDQDKAGREQYKTLQSKLLINSSDVIFVDGNKNPNSMINFTIEDIFSKNDKNLIGISNEDYCKEKAYYSLEILKKIENNEVKYDEETIKNFDKIIKHLFES